MEPDMKMEPARERESNELTVVAMSKSGTEDEFKPEEKVIAERENVYYDEDSVSQDNFNNEGAKTPDFIQTSRTDSILIQTENPAETLSARIYNAEERNGLEIKSEDGRKSINTAMLFGKALSKSKVPENAVVMKDIAEYSVQLQSPDCESPEIDPFCRTALTEDLNDSCNTTDSDLNTKQETDDSTCNCNHDHHSDNQEESNHVSIVSDSITQEINRDYVLQNNQELKDNSTADQVKPSVCRNHSIESAKNAPKDSVIATKLSKPSVSDDKPSQKPSKFRELWAQRNADPQKSLVSTNKPPLQLPVFTSPPAVKTAEGLQKLVPSTVRSEPEQVKNWGTRVTKRIVPKDERQAQENPVGFVVYESSESGPFRPEVLETPRSLGVTSQPTFRNESVQKFGTQSKHLQYQSPREISASTPLHQILSTMLTNEPAKSSSAPVTDISSSSEELTDAYICYMIEKINKLKLKDFPLPGKGSTNLYVLWENGWKQINDLSLVKATDRQHFETLMRFLSGSVSAAEQFFADNVCFPIPVKMDRELGIIFDVPPSLITDLPDDFITVLHSAISAFREEYRQRNRQILAHETQIREILMDHSVEYFRQELHFQAIDKPAKKYADLEEFRQIEEKLRKSVTSNFFTACSPDFWRAKLEQRLHDQLEATALKIEEINELNKSALYGLLAVVHEAIDVYENTMKQLEKEQPFERCKEMFREHDKAAHTQALQTFEAGSTKVTGFQGPYHDCLEEAIKRLDNAANHRWSRLVQEEIRIADENVRIAREQARIAHEEANRRKKEEEERRESESRRQLAHTITRNQRPSHSETFNENKDVGNRQQWLQSEDVGKSPSDNRAQYARASSVATDNSVGFTSMPSHEMPSVTLPRLAELAIHMGLNFTQVAYITPATGRFNLIANVRNRLYWNEREQELTPAFDKAVASGSPVINFERDLALWRYKGYDFLQGHRQFCWDLQEVLSQFLVCLKRKAEMELRMEFNASVVSVPQFLNESQRLRLRQSATIAGFDTVTFVNDTTAIAVVHMVDEEAVKGNVVVVNTQEGPVDIASFAFDHGRLECHGVTGDYFFEDHKGFWRDVKELLDGVTELFVGHPKNTAKSYFSQKELGISPSSSNTKYLLLGKDENYEACFTAIRKATKHAKYIGIHDCKADTALYGTAYICCLRSRDPCNSVLLKWQDKLHVSSKVIDSKVLDDLERKILKPDRNLKKNMNMTTGYLLTSEEVQHRRAKLNTSKQADLYRGRLALLKLINSMEKSQIFSDRQVSVSTQQHLDSYSKQLFQQDLNPDKLKKIQDGLMALRNSSSEGSGSLV